MVFAEEESHHQAQTEPLPEIPGMSSVRLSQIALTNTGFCGSLSNSDGSNRAGG